MIGIENVSKSYGSHTAVDGVNFQVHPGRVTGFLGPNGAGKSTTMRLILGLDEPSSGSITVNGRTYAESRAPLTEVGSLLNVQAAHPGRTAEAHLRALALTHGIPRARVREVAEQTGLDSVIRKRVGGFSLGMSQRLGIAAALLGDPRTLVLDEPINGLDPEGVVWIRELLKDLAAAGRTVFLSSHLMSEMALTADHLVIIGKGRIIADRPIGEVLSEEEAHTVALRTAETDRLARLLTADGAEVEAEGGDRLAVRGTDGRRIAEIALENRVLVYELTPQRTTLEDAYIDLTRESVEYQAAGRNR
ncbi:ABC transporter ATP-binding protein [Streptomonospora wellingtoniae]|uniref:ATP-binding cassette domain-containing protein n=1 Tax=Streptomonospora wellingtoniae TaxID=3075544 RepID=A0ABU2KW78_9ACTN|nr:ATP-binding cassette domain-containing protein [Streptomonospora sp. DSM 45055]MDT0303427.1 ATP-binding cassette domain-containing protein [Streptomonospora sp. DSM 45055]